MKPPARSYSATPLKVLMCFPTCKHSRICSYCWTTSLGTGSASELICSKAERPEATICLPWQGWWMNSTQTVDVKQTSVGNMRNTKWAHKLHFVWTLFPPLAEAVNVTTLVTVWCNDVIQIEIITREGKKKYIVSLQKATNNRLCNIAVCFLHRQRDAPPGLPASSLFRCQPAGLHSEKRRWPSPLHQPVWPEPAAAGGKSGGRRRGRGAATTPKLRLLPRAPKLSELPAVLDAAQPLGHWSALPPGARHSCYSAG